jgi:hypothetical protein
LEFGKPDEAALVDLPDAGLVQLGRALEGRGEWDSLSTVVVALRDRGKFPAEAAYFGGRVALAQSRSTEAVERLAEASAAGELRASYFYGVALEGAGRVAEAIQAYAATPEGGVFHAMALARAAALAPDAAARQALLAQLDGALATLSPVATAEAGSRWTPVAFGREATDAANGGFFPLLILWEDAQGAQGEVRGVKITGGTEDTLAVLEGSKRLLQLRWVENRVNWESIERVYPGDEALPGWIDAGRDWFMLRSVPGFSVARDGADNSALELSSFSWIFSVPLRVTPEGRYLVLGRTQDPGAKARFGWDILDKDSGVLRRSADTVESERGGWKERADCVVPSSEAEALRLVFETRPPITAPVLLDDAAVISIVEPAPP